MRYNLHTATMVEFELFSGATDDRKRQDVEDILRLCTILPFSSEVARQAAKIYQTLKQNNEIIEIRDIIIAATAILYDVPVITLNQDHFQRIEHLRLIAPHRIKE
jgi:tRNA(fMet)-specific endonuclease VapC